MIVPTVHIKRRCWRMLAPKWAYQRPPTWDLAARLIAANHAGVRVPSVRHFSGVNIVLWKWNDYPDRHIAVLDPKSDLPTDQNSWNV